MFHLRCLAVGFVAVLVGGVATTDRTVAAEPGLTAARRVAREAETKLLAGLHKPVKAEWSDVPVEQVLESLAKTAGVNLWIDREALAADGISTDQSVVNLHLGEATVWQSLHFLLKPLLLDWHGSDGVLAITTRVRADEVMVTRTYDVQAMAETLQRRVKNLPPRNRNDIGSWTSGASGFFSIPESADPAAIPAFVLPQFGGSAGQGGFGLVGPGNPGIPIGSRSIRGEEVLAQMLVECIGAKWELVDGEGGAISLGRGRLIVRHAYRVHVQIRELLLAVEEFVVRGATVKSILVGRPGYPHDEDAAIWKRLAQPEDIEVNDAPLDETLALMAKEGGYRLWIDRESLSSDGIALDQPVTLKLSGAMLDTVLHKLLDPLLLTFVVEEGTLIVATKVKSEEMLSTRVCFTGDVPEARSIADLVTSIQEATSGNWEAIDGEGGTLSMAVPEWLVIRQAQAVHREIAEMLDDLRQPAVAPAEAAAPEVELRLYPVADESALGNLIDALPTLVPTWDAKHGSIARLGHSLAIKQPALVHERLDEIFSALDQAHARLNPPKPPEQPKPEQPKPAPASK